VLCGDLVQSVLCAPLVVVLRPFCWFCCGMGNMENTTQIVMDYEERVRNMPCVPRLNIFLSASVGKAMKNYFSFFQTVSVQEEGENVSRQQIELQTLPQLIYV
jgi:hypothetical protein